MKGKLRRFGLVSLVLLAGLLLAAPATAQAIRTDFTAWDIPGSFSGGRTWMEDGTLYIRDLEGTSQIYQVSPTHDLGIAGQYSVALSANVDMTTGCGHVWGKAGNMQWSVSYTGQICYDALGNPVSFTTRGIGQGQGERKGLQMRYENVDGFMTGSVLETPSQ